MHDTRVTECAADSHRPRKRGEDRDRSAETRVNGVPRVDTGKHWMEPLAGGLSGKRVWTRSRRSWNPRLGVWSRGAGKMGWRRLADVSDVEGG